MSFWMKKKPSLKGEDTGLENGERKKKDEKKGPAPKRIDNLRISQKLQISIRSLGSQNAYAFTTKDLSATGAFIICSQFENYPFQPHSTLLDCVIELVTPDTGEKIELRFLGKIARIVTEKTENLVPGFGLRIVQIAREQWQTLEAFIAHHGAAINETESNKKLSQAS